MTARRGQQPWFDAGKKLETSRPHRDDTRHPSHCQAGATPDDHHAIVCQAACVRMSSEGRDQEAGLSGLLRTREEHGLAVPGDRRCMQEDPAASEAVMHGPFPNGPHQRHTGLPRPRTSSRVSAIVVDDVHGSWPRARRPPEENVEKVVMGDEAAALGEGRKLYRARVEQKRPAGSCRCGSESLFPAVKNGRIAHQPHPARGCLASGRIASREERTEKLRQPLRVLGIVRLDIDHQGVVVK